MINSYSNDALPKLTDQVFGFVGKPNPEAYAKAVKELHESESSRKILESRMESIEQDPELSRSQKEAYKTEAYMRHCEIDAEQMKSYADIVDREAEKKGEIAMKLIVGITIGLAALGAALGVANGIQNYTGLHIEPRTKR